MLELIFPLVALVFVFLVIVPALTLVSTIVLAKWAPSQPWKLGSWLHFALLVGPVLVPAVYFFSAGLHESEPGESIALCAQGHIADAICNDAAAFSFLTLLLFGFAFVRQVRGFVPPKASSHREGLLRRIRNLVGAPVGAGIDVVKGAQHQVMTVGLRRPRILIDETFGASLDDAQLQAVLLHEDEHARHLDPLRLTLLSVCIALNPARRLLRRHVAAWHFARELQCDRSAVSRGACPLALSEAIVRAARGSLAAPANVACLEGRTGALHKLEARVHLLLGYADASPEFRSRGRVVSWAMLAVVALLVIPHMGASEPMSLLHNNIEDLLHLYF